VLDAVSYRDDSIDQYDPKSTNAFIDKKFKEKVPEMRAV
jgi:hypothetical protein